CVDNLCLVWNPKRLLYWGEASDNLLDITSQELLSGRYSNPFVDTRSTPGEYKQTKIIEGNWLLLKYMGQTSETLDFEKVRKALLKEAAFLDKASNIHDTLFQFRH